MPLSALDTYHVTSAYKRINPPSTFLKDRYFNETQYYMADSAIAEFENESEQAAPFCVPGHDGIPVERGAFALERYENPFISLTRGLTMTDLERIGFGEALNNQMTPEQRQDVIYMNDVKSLDNMISRTEERMCSDVMLNNSITITSYADSLASAKAETETIYFYEGASNPAVLTITTDWDESNASIMSDLSRAVELKTGWGQSADDLICAPNVARAIMANAEIQKYLDNRRYFMGEIEPELKGRGVCLHGVLNIDGYMIGIYSYNASYINDSKVRTRYIPDNYCVLATRSTGVFTYAKIGEMEDDNQFHYHAERRVIKNIADKNHNVKEVKVSARPLPLLKDKNPFISMMVIGN